LKIFSLIIFNYLQLLREKCDKLINENKQLRMDLMRRKILENGIHNDLFLKFILNKLFFLKIGNDEDFETPTDNPQNLQFIGMFEYKQQNESLILRILINGKDFDECIVIVCEIFNE
jgi:hypothetical protein